MARTAFAAHRYDAVLFDLDGVLTSTTALHIACWREARDGQSPADEWSVHGIGNRKQALVERALARHGVDAFPGSVAWIRQLRRAGVLTAVVTSSANGDEVLRAAGIGDLFELTVDGNDIRRRRLRGKPAPDGFLAASGRLGVPPSRSVVVEDALAGVAAGRAGAFGRVIGVARNVAPAELRAAGADVVVPDLGELAA
jgi:alpha,alpha-trehalose phosphorylase